MRDTGNEIDLNGLSFLMDNCCLKGDFYHLKDCEYI